MMKVNESVSTESPTYLDQIREDLHYIILPIVVIFGSVGNSLAFAVLFRRRMRTKSLYFYLTILACSDTIVLYVGAFRNWIRVLTNLEFLHTSTVSCKLGIFLIAFSQHLSAWLIVLLTIDRFITIWCPFCSDKFCTVRKARIMTVMLIFVLTLYTLPVFWKFNLVPANPTPLCTINENDPFHYIFDYLKAATYCLFPSSLVLILNSCIIYKVIKSRKAREHLTQSESAQALASCRLNRTEYHVTSMLLVISFVWLGLTTPYGIFSVARYQIGRLLTPSQVRFIVTICFLLFYLNHGVNFYIYCLTGRTIRREFFHLILSIRRRSTACKKTQRSSAAVVRNDMQLTSHFNQRPIAGERQ